MTSKSSPYAGDEEEAVCDVASTSTPVTSISSELERPSNMLSAGSKETGDWASRFGWRATELATEGWDRERPVPRSSARSNCEPHECRRRSASAGAGPAPRGADAWLPSSVNKPSGSAAVSLRNDHSEHSRLPQE